MLQVTYKSKVTIFLFTDKLLMKKKHAPEQYAAKPKTRVVKSSSTPSEHPAVGVAKVLVSWLERGGVPPSVILLHGLHLARSPEDDGLPVDTYRPQLKMQGTDSKAISKILNALARPQAAKTQVIAAWLQSNWVKKSARASRIFSFQKKRETPIPPNKPAKHPRKAQGSSPAKPVVVVKKKETTDWTARRKQQLRPTLKEAVNGAKK